MPRYLRHAGAGALVAAATAALGAQVVSAGTSLPGCRADFRTTVASMKTWEARTRVLPADAMVTARIFVNGREVQPFSSGEHVARFSVRSVFVTVSMPAGRSPVRVRAANLGRKSAKVVARVRPVEGCKS